jgi:hypothetical protein
MAIAMGQYRRRGFDPPHHASAPMDHFDRMAVLNTPNTDGLTLNLLNASFVLSCALSSTFLGCVASKISDVTVPEP